MNEECLFRLALIRLPGVGIMTARRLLQAAGSAVWLFGHRKELPALLPDVSPKLVKALDCPEVLRACEAELKFAERNHIACLTDEEEAYPSRLRECADAPVVLFYRGNADLNRLHVVSLVGTRKATAYGQDLCQRLVGELKELVPDVLVVSGLAYGIDIAAHRAALQCGAATIGVLAHGLDRIYPYVHRSTAAKMLEQGGLLTEFASGTSPDRQNFISRNRIVAGMADATVVVESAAKGGALITAEMAVGYGRECFAVPGRVGDAFSAGCNQLIRTNRALLLQSAEELVSELNWNVVRKLPADGAVQRQLFPEVSEDEQRLVQVLQRQAEEGMQLNALVVASGMPVGRVMALLLELEMKGLVRSLAGGVYRVVI